MPSTAATNSFDVPSPADGIRAGVRLTTRVFARLALVPFAAFAFVALTSAPTWSGVGYVSCLAVMLAGLATLPEPATSRPRRRGLTRGAAVGLFVIACLRVGFVRDGARLHVLDSEAPSGGSRIASRVVDEGDAALTTTRLLVGLGAVRDDASELPAAMRAAYNEMRADHGAVPSPLVPTYLGLQGREAFDLVVIDPPAGAPRPRGALVFLHGFAGNFDLPCWQISRALAELAVVTACPSTRWVGDWGSSDGEAALRRTLEILHARGIDRVVLAGLSNGGFGASVLAPRMKGSFVGLVLVSGATRDADDPGVPTLLIHGRRDGMVSIQGSRRYAEARGARLVELDAGHFAMLVRRREHDAALASFVAGVL